MRRAIKAACSKQNLKPFVTAVGCKLNINFSHFSIYTYCQYSGKEKTAEITEPFLSELKKEWCLEEGGKGFPTLTLICTTC